MAAPRRDHSQPSFKRRRSNTAQSSFRAPSATSSHASSNSNLSLGSNSSSNSNSHNRPATPPVPAYPPLKVGDSKVLHAWVHEVNTNDSFASYAFGIANVGGSSLKEKEKDPHKEWQHGVVFNHAWWPGAVEGDCLRVTSGSLGVAAEVGTGKKEGQQGNEKGFFFIVGKDEGNMKPQLQVSFPRPIADSFGLRNNAEVALIKVDKADYSADYVEFIFQDQYLGRGEMWRLGKFLAGQCVYRDQEISYIGGIVAKVSNIYIAGREVSSAYITTRTKSIYRSLSAKITIFIQVCRELWEFSGDGERYNEKIVHSFLPALFTKWREAGTNHTVTIVLVSRVFYDKSEIEYAAGPLQSDDERLGQPENADQEAEALWYKDFYKVITDLEVIHEWKPTLVSLKNSFWDFQRDVLLAHHYHRATVDSNGTGDTQAQVRLVGRLSDAHDGPILEALNLGLNPTETHYIDRSLNLTGSTTILISPGTGYFRVNKNLLRLTTRRMLDQGFVCNLVLLRKEPIFQSPVFRFVGKDPAGAHREREKKEEDGIGVQGVDGKERKVDPLLMDPLWGGDDEESSKGEKKTFWWEPFWMSTTFWDKQMYLPFRQDRFVARGNMHEIQMLGLLEHDVLSSIEVPYIPEKQNDDLNATIGSTLSKEDADKFDLDTFALSSKYGANAVPTFNSSGGLSSSTTSLSSTATAQTITEKRGSHRHSTIVRIEPIEESPKPPIHKELPTEEPVTPKPPPRSMTAGTSRPALESLAALSGTTLSNLSTSPSQSSIRSARSDRSSSSRGPSSGQKSNSGTLSKGLASKLAPSWLFNPFRSGPSEPQTTPISASASPTSSASGKLADKFTSSTEKDHTMLSPSKIGRGAAEKADKRPATPSSSPLITAATTSSSPIRMPLPKPTVAPSTAQIQPMAIRGKAANRTSWSRGLEEDTLQRAAYMRRSPMNTPPSDGILSSKRRSTSSAVGVGSMLLSNSYTSSITTSALHLLNPTRPKHQVPYPQASLARRWQHIFPKPVFKHDIKWTPIVTPGCLPLTVEHFPTSAELEMSYDVFSYEFLVDPKEMKSFLVKPPIVPGQGHGKGKLTGDDLRRAYALVVMRGMAAVRLAQGFQFVLSKSKRGSADFDDTAKSISGTQQAPTAFRRNKSFAGADEPESRPAGAADVLRSTTDPVYLSMTNEIHRISYNGEAIQVKRYVRRMTPSTAIQYKCLIWPKLGVGYTEHTTEFKSHGLENYGWNRLDMLVAGYEHDFNESMRYWRTRFIVVPTIEPPRIREVAGNEELNEEEARILGIERLAELFTKLRWQSPDEKSQHPAPPVRFLPTTLDPAMCVLDDGLMDHLDEIHAQGPLRKKMKSDREIAEMSQNLMSIAKAMREEDGVPIKFHQWHGSPYPDSFIGYDFVSWLAREFRDVNTRTQAVEWGNKLQDKGLFEHCRGKHSFLDGHYYYRLVGEYSVHSTPKYWFMKQDGILRTPNLQMKPSKPSSKSGSGSTRKGKKSLILSQTMVTDIDPNKKSDQAESVILHHDIIHNPATGFHFELQWIGTTARCIEDQLKAWNRNIEDYGLKIVEAYVTQITDIREHNPFQSCYPLRLAVAPPVIPDLDRRIPDFAHPARYFEYALLRRFNFILDIEAGEMYPDMMDVVYSYRRSPYKYSQFVHASGVAFVQVVGGTQGFLFLTNRLMASGRGSSGNRYKSAIAVARTQDLAREAEKLREQMEEFFSSKRRLERFYEDLVNRLPSPPAVEEPPPLAI